MELCHSEGASFKLVIPPIRYPNGGKAVTSPPHAYLIYFVWLHGIITHPFLFIKGHLSYCIFEHKSTYYKI